MKTIKRFSILFTLLALVASPVFAQATLTSTTLSAAVGSTFIRTISVTSATGWVAQYVAFVDKEAFTVLSVSGTTITVARGAGGTRASTHASGTTIYVGPANYFTTFDRSGSCTSASELVLPRVNMINGNVWNCVGSLWTLTNVYGASAGYTTDILTNVNVGAANTSVTVVEYGTARDHTSKLTFTDLAIGSAVGAADLAFGKLLYTFPAGVVVVKSAYMSVALTGSGATCDADTPDGGLGTVIGSGAVATLDGTATFEDILTGQTFNNLTGTAEVKTLSQVLPVEAASAHTVHFNLADGWAGACDVTGTGTVTLEWSFIN